MPPLLHELGALKDLQVLADGGQAEVERGGELPDGCLPLDEAVEDRPTGGIGEGAEDGAEVVCLSLPFPYRLINLLA